MRRWKVEYVIVAITVAFVAFTGGFFAGRNTRASTADAVAVSTQFKPQASAAAAPVQPQTEQTQAAEKPAGPVDINRATTEELMTLPGIGEALAGRIIEYRESFGAFGDVDELSQVEGIGERKLDAVRDLITVR